MRDRRGHEDLALFHILKGAKIGERCIFGQNCQVAENVVIGNNVKVQNNVRSTPEPIIEDDVFLGPSCVLTNVTNPRSQVNRHSLVREDHLPPRRDRGRECHHRLRHRTRPLLLHRSGSGGCQRTFPITRSWSAIPARQIGWMSRHGHRLVNPDANGIMRCPESGFRYKEVEPGILRCLDLDEEAPLPAELTAAGPRPTTNLKPNLPLQEALL